MSRLARVALFVLVGVVTGFGAGIHDAAEHGDLQLVKALLEGNPDLVFGKDTNGFTPLLIAAESGQADVAKLLLANRADIKPGRKRARRRYTGRR